MRLGRQGAGSWLGVSGAGSVPVSASEQKDLWVPVFRAQHRGREEVGMIDVRAEVLNLWVLTPVGVKQPPYGGHIR